MIKMTKAQYESLPLDELKKLAKSRGLKGVSALRKEALIRRMLEEDAREAEEELGESPENAPDKAPEVYAGREERRERREPSGGREYREKREPSEGREKGADSREGRERRELSGGRGRREQAENREPREEKASGGDMRAVQPRDTRTMRDAREQRGTGAREEREQENTQNIRSGGDGEEFIKKDFERLDSGEEVEGILEVMSDGYGFIRSDNFLPGENDVYVAPSQIRRFRLKTGDILRGNTRVKSLTEKFSALLYVKSVNGLSPAESAKRINFEDMTPIFPNERVHLERLGGSTAMRIVDLVSPIGKGQRGMIVSPPKAGKTSLLKDVAKSVLRNNPEMHLMILLIDERPEEVTDIREDIQGNNVEVIYSTFDELPEHHKRVSEMVIERAKRLVENKRDVIIFIDSITRLARAYNQTVPPSGRTLSGGLDPAALHMPKRFFGAARNMREGGSLTILATALVDTGSKMDDVIYEEFKGTGNMELVLDRKLQERRVFPAIDIAKSGTRREDLLLTAEEQEAVNIMRRALNGMKADEAVENLLNLFAHTRTNQEVVSTIRRQKYI